MTYKPLPALEKNATPFLHAMINEVYLSVPVYTNARSLSHNIKHTREETRWAL